MLESPLRASHRALLLAWLALGSPGGAAAAVLTGAVTDRETGEPLSFTSVQVSGEGYRNGTVSDQGGRFTLGGLAAGTYTLQFFYVGYADRRDTVTVAAGDTLRLAVRLEAEGFAVAPVTVVAEKMEEAAAPVGFLDLDVDRLTLLPGAIESDPIRTLQLLPGIQAASDISSGLYVRGGGPDQTLILLDDVILYNPSHAFGLFSTFNADAIDGIALYKGAYPAEYTGRLGAVLDVTGKTGERRGFAGKAGLSSISGRMLLEGPVGSGSYMVSGRRTYLDPLLDVLRRSEPQIPGYYFYDLNGAATQSVGGGVLTVSGYWGRDDLLFDLSPESRINLDWGNRTLSARYSRFLDETVLAQLTASTSEYESITDAVIFNTPVFTRNLLRDFSLRADLDAETGERNRVRAGVQGSLYRFTFDQVFNRESEIDFREEPFDLTAYAEDAWESGDRRTSLRAGLRARYFSSGDRFLLEPRISAIRRLSERVRLKAGAGLYHQYLQLVTTEGFSAGDFYAPVDATTEPGRSLQGVLGVSWVMSRDYQVSAEVYYTDLDNLLVFDDNVTREQQEAYTTDDLFVTGGHGHAAGLELFLEKRRGALRGWAGYTLGRTRRTFAEINEGRSFPPKYDRRHDLNLAATYEAGPWTASGSFVFATGQAYTPAVARYVVRDPALGDRDEGGFVLAGERNSARLLPYHRLDVSLSRKFRLFDLDATWFVQVFNLYSRRNEWFVQFDSEDPANEPEVVRQLPVIPSLGVSLEF
jgi:hypothetical protein